MNTFCRSSAHCCRSVYGIWPERVAGDDVSPEWRLCLLNENQTYLQFLRLGHIDHLHDEKPGGEEDNEETNQCAGAKDSHAARAESDRRKILVGPLNWPDDVYMEEFMSDCQNEDQISDAIDQIDTVLEFCRTKDTHEGSGESNQIKSQEETCRGIIHDSAVFPALMGDDAERNGNSVNMRQLHEHLALPRFNDLIPVSGDVPSDPTGRDFHFIERRLIFIVNPSPLCLKALASTASRSQAVPLQSLFYRYLKLKSLIDINLPSRGVRQFSLQLHLPRFILRCHDHDTLPGALRKASFRTVKKLDFLMKLKTSRDARPPPYTLLEAQTSILVTGLADDVWTAYGFVDIDTDGHEVLSKYETSTAHGSLPDPLADGHVMAGKEKKTARWVFLTAWNFWLQKTCRDWAFIAETIDSVVKDANERFPLSSKAKRARFKVEELADWNTEMFKLTMPLVGVLSETTRDWDEFELRSQLGYFHVQNPHTDEAQIITRLLGTIAASYSKLRSLQAKLSDATERLGMINQRALDNHWTLQNNKIATFVQVLTVSSTVFLPLSITSALFSTQGVLPFVPSLASFSWSVVCVGVLVFGTLLAIQWDAWVQPLLWRIQTGALHWVKDVKLLNRTGRSSKKEGVDADMEEEREDAPYRTGWIV